ncbi:MAG: hypothetical protein CMH46_10775 [Muricauda sp.]|nr:hypothetical protein [Allomuricauda sp.]
MINNSFFVSIHQHIAELSFSFHNYDQNHSHYTPFYQDILQKMFLFQSILLLVFTLNIAV